MVKDIITRAFKERWFVDKSNLVKNPILRTYDKIKHDFIMEPYLYLVKKPKYRIAISKLRCSSHTLAIEKGRHTKPRTNLSERLSLFCRSKKVEDEKHFIIECCLYSDERDRLFTKMITVNPDFASMHDDDKFEYLFRTDNERTLAWLGKFIHESLSKRVAT